MGSGGSKSSGADYVLGQQYYDDDSYTAANDHGIGDDFEQEKFTKRLQSQPYYNGQTIIHLGPVKRNLKYYDTTTKFSSVNRFVEGGRLQIWPTPEDYPIHMPNVQLIHQSAPLSSEHQGDHVELLKYVDVAYYNAHPDARF
jgi:hypothetical protein